MPRQHLARASGDTEQFALGLQDDSRLYREKSGRVYCRWWPW